MEFTFYADWHPEEFEELTVTTQRYTGVKNPVPSTIPVLNNSNWRYLMPSSDPCDDVLDNGAENTLRATICKPQNCSVSWAFAVTNSIEYAITGFPMNGFIFLRGMRLLPPRAGIIAIDSFIISLSVRSGHTPSPFL